MTKKTKDNKRDYGNNYLSVTEVLGHVRKIGLEMWYKQHTAKECDELSEKAKEIGTQIHELIESYVKGQKAIIKTKYQEEVNNGLKSFLKFRKEHPEIKLEWAEQKITNDDIKLNGTIDCLGKDSEGKVIIDWKTGECKQNDFPTIYTEYLLQLGAYAFLYDSFFKRKEIVKKAYVVVLAKDQEAYAIKELDYKELWQPAKTFFCLLDFVQNKKELEKMLKDKESTK
jgi:ATP-dependent exoDNAse (exonuclease V) beta subunit